jgi:hypothetical protein
MVHHYHRIDSKRVWLAAAIDAPVVVSQLGPLITEEDP